MGRNPTRNVPPPTSRQDRGALVTAGMAVILLFALVGVASAGIWAGGKISGGSHKSAAGPTATPGSNAVTQADIARARAQATQIVKTAQQTGRTIVQNQTTQAKKQAAAIVSAARRRASSIVASAPPARSSPPASQAPVSQPPAAAGTTGGVTTSPGRTGIAQGSSTYGPAVTGGSQLTAPPANLGPLPSSWLVVAYNATFGSGPGSVGGVTVTNRSSKTFSGYARVVYRTGASATASFAGLAPGQTVVLPLNGAAYPGGGYSLQVGGLR